MRIHSNSYKKKSQIFLPPGTFDSKAAGGGAVDNNPMMCVGSVAVIWLVDYWVLYGQPWLMPTHPQRPTHKITALPYQRSSSCCTAKYQDDHFRLTTDQKKSAFQRSTFCGCTDFLLDENFLCYLSSMLSWCCWCKRCSHSPSQKKWETKLKLGDLNWCC